jgi:chromosome condensin MukBEF MukE localization factor
MYSGVALYALCLPEDLHNQGKFSHRNNFAHIVTIKTEEKTLGRWNNHKSAT